VSDLDEYRDADDRSDVPRRAGTAPRLFYGSADDFVRERLIYMYARRVGPGNARFRWAADWWNYPEALARVDAMWRAWEYLRLDGATGASRWWIDHADQHMPVLLSPEGPFARSKDTNEPGEPLPYTPPPEGLFPDMRET
jgi:hypothetical protein